MTLVPGSIPKMILSGSKFMIVYSLRVLANGGYRLRVIFQPSKLLMQQSKKIKSIRFWEWPAKITIAALATWFIYQSVIKKAGVDELLHSYTTLFDNLPSILLVISVTALMIINWSLEAWKWQLMISKVEH